MPTSVNTVHCMLHIAWRPGATGNEQFDAALWPIKDSIHWRDLTGRVTLITPPWYSDHFNSKPLSLLCTRPQYLEDAVFLRGARHFHQKDCSPQSQGKAPWKTPALVILKRDEGLWQKGSWCNHRGIKQRISFRILCSIIIPELKSALDPVRKVHDKIAQLSEVLVHHK
jgi:hypothetical protein